MPSPRAWLVGRLGPRGRFVRRFGVQGALEALATLMTLLGISVALWAADIVSDLAIFTFLVLLLFLVERVLDPGLAGDEPVPRTRRRPSRLTFIVLLPNVTFVAAIMIHILVYELLRQGDREAGAAYDELTEFFATAAQIMVGLLVALAFESRLLATAVGPARITHRHGILQVMIAAAAALLALGFSECRPLQVFGAFLVTGGVSAAFLSLLVLSSDVLRRFQEPTA